MHYSELTEEQKQKRRDANRRWRDRNPDARREYWSMYYRRSSDEYTLFKAARDRAKREKFPFSITENDIKISDNCPICANKMSRSEVVGGWRYSPTLDKVVPENGYTPGNIAVICKFCNSVKGAGTAEHHRQIADYIETFK